MQNKQQEFLKQRERLKYVTQNNIAKKPLDPDIMIEQLISDKETFKFSLERPLPYAIPKWLKVENNLVPAVYEHVWQAVKLGPTFQYCDTNIITHLFTTSGLSLEKLGYLWSLTNVCSPGFLIQQELYVMLALIALVQTGYHVSDISIINSINHPVLPQLDYSFLKITVANPAINRSAKSNDVKPSHSIVINGISSLMPSDPVSVPVKSWNEIIGTKQQTLKNSSAFSSTPLSVESLKSSLPIDVSSANAYKSSVDVAFAIPERSRINVDFSSTPKIPLSELNVDFSVPSVNVEADFNSLSKPKTNFGILALDARMSESNAFFKESCNVDSNFLNVNSVVDSLEPRSLDLPEFSEHLAPIDDDEFTEFQSAVAPAVDEYSDFQSASPIAKYEFREYADKLRQSTFDLTPESKSVQEDLVTDEPVNLKTSIEADKYDVFRALMEPSREEKVESAADDGCSENGYDDEKEDEDFGDFCAADVKQTTEKREKSIKDKCLEACLRLLREGLRIFSSISKEQTMKEVLSDEKGCRYFYQLKIVYDTSQRFQRQFESTDLNDSIQSTWAQLSKYTKYISDEDLLDEVPSEDDVDASPCKLCETKCDVNCVRYAGHNYHVTCINLFLHFVEDSEIAAMLNI